MPTGLAQGGPKTYEARVGDDAYRGQLGAALARIEVLEGELAAIRTDPAYERVVVAEERLRAERERLAKAPRVSAFILLGSIVMMGCAGLASVSNDRWLGAAALLLGVMGIGGVLGAFLAIVRLALQGTRPAHVLELERQARMARGDAGMRLEGRRVRIADSLEAAPASADADNDREAEGAEALSPRTNRP